MKGQIEIDDEENFGKKIKQEVINCAQQTSAQLQHVRTSAQLQHVRTSAQQQHVRTTSEPQIM